MQGELHLFRNRGADDPVLADMHQEWQRSVATCECSWSTPAVERAYFPTYRTHPDIDPVCPVHAIITAADDYCLLIDDDWNRIADWYRITAQPDRGPTPGEHYAELRRRTLDKGIDQWPPWDAGL